MFDFGHPFFRPLWVRVVVVAVALGWGLYEFATGAPFWGVLFGALGLYAAWHLLIRYDPKDHP